MRGTWLGMYRGANEVTGQSGIGVLLKKDSRYIGGI